MTALIFYGIILGVLLAGAAHFLDRGLRNLGRPTRWIWVMAMMAAVGIPFASVVWESGPSPTPGNSTIPVDLLYQMLAGGSGAGQGPTGTPFSLDRPLVLFWLVGSGSLLLVAVWAFRRLHRATRRWERRQVGNDSVLVSEGLGPAVLGLIRPIIVIPPWVLDLSQEKRDMILLHEKEHQGARDPALLAWGLLLVATMPWSPALWWMARRLHLAVEGDCDARVLALGIPAKCYGNLLLEVASGGRGLSAFSPALAEGGETILERRLLMIRANVREKGLLPAVMPILLSAGFLALACETPTPPVAEDQELSLEVSEVPAPVSEAEDGYFLVRKTAGKVEYVGPVSEGQLELIGEDPQGQVDAFTVREVDPGGGAIRIRANAGEGGEASGPKPLIIVDGVIVSDENILETLNKEDIESIEIVKSAAAEALYGERGAAGVILITLKH